VTLESKAHPGSRDIAYYGHLVERHPRRYFNPCRFSQARRGCLSMGGAPSRSSRIGADPGFMPDNVPTEQAIMTLITEFEVKPVGGTPPPPADPVEAVRAAIAVDPQVLRVRDESCVSEGERCAINICCSCREHRAIAGLSDPAISINTGPTDGLSPVDKAVHARQMLIAHLASDRFQQ
jgi:hypothetical protein